MQMYKVEKKLHVLSNRRKAQRKLKKNTRTTTNEYLYQFENLICYSFQPIRMLRFHIGSYIDIGRM